MREIIPALTTGSNFDFFLVYTLLSLGALILGWVISRIMTSRGGDFLPGGPPNPEDIALIAGGGKRLLETVLARLVHAKLVIFPRSRIYRTIGSLPPTASEMEKEVFTRLHGMNTEGSFGRIRWRTRNTIISMQEGLVARGLLQSVARWRVIHLFAAAPAVLMMLLGGVRIVSVFFDGFSLLMTAIILAAHAGATSWMLGHIGRATLLGRSLVRRARGAYQTIPKKDSLNSKKMRTDEVTLCVALFGLRVFKHGNVAKLRTISRREVEGTDSPYFDYNVYIDYNTSSSSDGGCGGDGGGGD